jgi:putative redox protein
MMARVAASISAARYRVSIRAGSHDLLADEGPALGGGDEGPNPYDLLLASLGACTAITLKMYGERKGWPLAGVDVALSFHHGLRGRIDRRLTLHGDLDGEQKSRLAEIAERTPVTLTLKAGVDIDTRIADQEI